MSEKFIPLSVPNIKGNEVKYVTQALEDEWVSTGGTRIEEFEQKLGKYVKSEGAVACQSGTAGLHLALRYYGISPEDMIIVPTLTFIAAVNPVMYEKAEPIFMDCDDSLCMDPDKLRRFLEKECTFDGQTVIFNRNKKMIKAIIIVHVFGNMADMEQIMQIANMYCLPVIEDATEALGTYYTSGKYKGKYAGTIGNIGVYSFNGNKIITTGGGGMVVSNNRETLQKIKYLSTQAKDDTVNFIHNEVGFNYRMTNIQAAIGVAQLEQLESFIEAKNRNYFYYRRLIEEFPGVSFLCFKENIRSNCWFYSLLLEEGYNKQELIDFFLENKIQTRPIWGLISEQKPYIDCYKYQISRARYYHERIVNVPCSTNLSEDDINRVIEVLNKFMKH